MPTPGSEAAFAREARLARQRQRRGITETPDGIQLSNTIAEEPKKPQRQQPVNKNRAKKKPGGNRR
jgi:YidC/Oxa1 family membrane protein insertase